MHHRLFSCGDLVFCDIFRARFTAERTCLQSICKCEIAGSLDVKRDATGELLLAFLNV